jgi:hypothetical protein
METDLVEVARFVRLVDNLTVEALNAVDVDALPARDRSYVRRVRILATEDADLVQRQRVVWLKLRRGIRLLEGEARELLEVLGCRGFYFCGLNLDGMVFCTLDLSGGMIVGDYSCQYTRVRGPCDERDLVVVGHYLSQHRRLDGSLATEGLRVLAHTAASQAAGTRDPASLGASARPGATHSQDTHAPGRSNDAAVGVEELSEADIINSCVPSPKPASPDRSGRYRFPPPPSSLGSTTRRGSLPAPRMGSGRCSRPPRASTSVSPPLTPLVSLTPSRMHLEPEPSLDTSDIDGSWD